MERTINKTRKQIYMVSDMVLLILGIDVSKRTFNVTLLVKDKEKSKKFSNDAVGFLQLQQWLTELAPNGVHACMEATGRYYELLAEFLYSAGHRVSAVNPARIKGYAQAELMRSKTDELDAGLIARFCQKHNPRAWKPPAKEVREVQEAERYLDALKGMRLQETNRLGSGLICDAVRDAIAKHIEQMDSEIAELEKWLKEQIKKHERLTEHHKLITSVIGIGNTTAFAWLGEIGYGDGFEVTRQVESFAGLTTKKTQSGTSIRGRERLSKVGNHYLRKALYMPAMCAMQHNPLIRSFAERLRERGKPPKVIIGAVMRKLLRVIFAVVKSGRPFDLQYHSQPRSSHLSTDSSPEPSHVCEVAV
jgi:transposase